MANQNFIFVDREKERRVITDTLSRGGNVWVIGEHGIGKTSLLLYLQNHFLNSQEHAIILFIQMGMQKSEEDFFAYLAKSIGIEEYKSPNDIVDHVKEKPVLLLLDEFDATYENPDFSNSFFQTLRSLTGTTQVQLIIASTHKLPDSRKGVASPLDNVFVLVDLKSFDFAVAQVFLDKIASDLGTKIDKNKVKEVVEVTRGVPRNLEQLLYLSANDPELSWDGVLKAYKEKLDEQGNPKQIISPEKQPVPAQAEPFEGTKQYTVQDDALDKHVATDKPIQSVKQDKLDFKIYVNALHSFILSKYTTTPITISIDGVWGTGKSSLMSMLKEKLDPQRDGVRKFFEWWSLLLPRLKWYWRFLWSSLPKMYGKALIALVVRNDVDNDGIYLYVGDRVQLFKNHVARIMDGFSIAPETLNQPENENLDKKVRWWAKVNANCEPIEPPYHYTVWLNAWKFDNQEEVWASLALATMEQIKQKHGLIWRLRFWWELTFSRFSFWSGLGQVIKQFLLPLIFAIVLASYNIIIESVSVPLDAFKDYGSPILWAGFVISGILSVSSIFKDPFQIPLDKVFDRPNYKDKVKFLSHFEKDFARIVRAATKNGFGWKRSKLVIFIDDLDRCEPPKSADIVEAVNLFLDAEGCVFVIGMDSESVAMSIEVKYKDLFERMKAENTGVVSLGRLFLDKIVQIPFSVPRPTPQQITSLVNDTLGQQFSLVNSDSKPILSDSIKDKSLADMLDNEPIKSGEKWREKIESALANISAQRVDAASYAKPEVRAAIFKGTELLADNPRQVKTFINLFRLSIYIANERKILEEKIVAEQTSGLNLEKLAIWTACSVRWTGLVRPML